MGLWFVELANPTGTVDAHERAQLVLFGFDLASGVASTIVVSNGKGRSTGSVALSANVTTASGQDGASTSTALGVTNSCVQMADTGCVMYDLYVSYTGSASVYLLVYDISDSSSISVGVDTPMAVYSFGPPGGSVPIGGPGRFFEHGVAVAATTDYVGATAPDKAIVVTFGYS